MNIEYYNAVLCYRILELFNWNYNSNFLAKWLCRQIPYENW